MSFYSSTNYYDRFQENFGSIQRGPKPLVIQSMINPSSMVESGLGFDCLSTLQKLTMMNVYPFHTNTTAQSVSVSTKPASPSTKLMMTEIHDYLTQHYQDDYLGHRSNKHKANLVVLIPKMVQRYLYRW